MVSTGYKGPKAARGLHPSGLRDIMVHNVKDLALVDPSVQAARIGHTVGKKKRGLIIAAAKEKKIRILNPGVTETAEVGEEIADGEEPAVEAEATEKAAEKPKGGRFGRRKPAEEEAPVEGEMIEQPKKKRKAAKPAKAEEEAKEEGPEGQ